jgi:arylsulfatase
MALRVDQDKIVFAEQRATGLEVWREPLVQLRIPKMFDLRSDPFEAGEESSKYADWFIEHVPFQLRCAGGRPRVARELQGIPAAPEGGELHRRPDRREADAEELGATPASAP